MIHWSLGGSPIAGHAVNRREAEPFQVAGGCAGSNAPGARPQYRLSTDRRSVRPVAVVQVSAAAWGRRERVPQGRPSRCKTAPRPSPTRRTSSNRSRTRVASSWPATRWRCRRTCSATSTSPGSSPISSPWPAEPSAVAPPLSTGADQGPAGAPRSGGPEVQMVGTSTWRPKTVPIVAMISPRLAYTLEASISVGIRFTSGSADSAASFASTASTAA